MDMKKPKRLTFIDGRFTRATHYLFRYPAKFHPPVARALVESFSNPGDTIFDPFCGSGTIGVESLLAGRNAVGCDIDPVAVFVSEVKTRRYNTAHLQASTDLLSAHLFELARSDREYERRQHDDIKFETVARSVKNENLWIPDIPNIQHWFRNYVLIDLARILQAINSLDVPRTHKSIFRLCFASIIRKCSNADPVPVSGLEVTSYMKQVEENGRIVNPYSLFQLALRKNLQAVREFCDETNAKMNERRFFQADATKVSSHLRSNVSVVITSPPYHSAVDYYRRHTLEMYWLGFTKTHAERLELVPHYIGRSRVARRHEFVLDGAELAPTVKKWERKLRNHCRFRADAFKHYAVAMRKTFRELANLLPSGGKAVFVVGKSKWGSSRIPTDSLFTEIAGEWFQHTDEYWYPIKNRYMSYSRHNGAGINQEHVIVLSRKV